VDKGRGGLRGPGGAGTHPVGEERAGVRVNIVAPALADTESGVCPVPRLAAVPIRVIRSAAAGGWSVADPAWLSWWVPAARGGAVRRPCLNCVRL